VPRCGAGAVGHPVGPPDRSLQQASIQRHPTACHDGVLQRRCTPAPVAAQPSRARSPSDYSIAVIRRLSLRAAFAPAHVVHVLSEAHPAAAPVDGARLEVIPNDVPAPDDRPTHVHAHRSRRLRWRDGPAEGGRRSPGRVAGDPDRIVLAPVVQAALLSSAVSVLQSSGRGGWAFGAQFRPLGQANIPFRLLSPHLFRSTECSGEIPLKSSDMTGHPLASLSGTTKLRHCFERVSTHMTEPFAGARDLDEPHSADGWVGGTLADRRSRSSLG
jgi:hypothetical protein